MIFFCVSISVVKSRNRELRSMSLLISVTVMGVDEVLGNFFVEWEGESKKQKSGNLIHLRSSLQRLRKGSQKDVSGVVKLLCCYVCSV